MKEFENVEVLLEGLDEENISSLLSKWKEVSGVAKRLEELKEMLRDKVQAYLKERDWERYLDDRTKISVSITNVKKQTVDKTQLRIMLTDAQYAQVIRTTTYEKMNIMTPEARERLKKYATKKKL
jgi:hypothetical protein